MKYYSITKLIKSQWAKDYKMTKAELNSQMVTLIEASKDDKKITKTNLITTIQEIMAEYNKSKSTKEDHPNQVNDEGVTTGVWCNKHLQYESPEGFVEVKTSKTGYHNKCVIADYQWKDFLSKIKDVETNLSTSLDNGDFDNAKIHNEDKKHLTILKDGKYEYPSNDEIVRISPKPKASKSVE